MKNKWIVTLIMLLVLSLGGCQKNNGAESLTPMPEMVATNTPIPTPELTATSTPTPVEKQEETGEHQGITLTTYQWEENGYCPEVIFYPMLTKQGFAMRIVVKEENPKRDLTEHFGPIYKDSCVEWFVNFTPEAGDAYMNFEVNANGAMLAEFHENKRNTKSLTAEEVEQLNIQTKVEETQWSVEYLVPFSLIETYFAGFEAKEEMEISTNFYKCGDGTKFPHYGVWNPIDSAKPDFHRPEFFGSLVLSMEK